MAKRFWRRKKYVINRQFQFRFVATFLVMIIVSLLVFSGGAAVFYWIRYMAGENIFSEFIFIHKQIRTYNEKGEPTGTKSEQLPPVNRVELVLPPLLINNLIILVLIAVIGIFYSHRIAGPAYRMEQDIARVLSGETGVAIRLRKKDKLKSLANKINLLIKELEEKQR